MARAPNPVQEINLRAKLDRQHEKGAGNKWEKLPTGNAGAKNRLNF